MTKTPHWLPTVLFVSLVILGWIVAEICFNPKPEPGVAIETLNELQKRSSEIIIEMNKLMTSLATLVIGGVGALLLKKDEPFRVQSRGRRMTMAVCSVFAVFSIYFGYILYFKMVEMLSNSFYDPSNALIEIPRRFQYYCLWLSVIFFVIFALLETTPPINQGPPANANKEVITNES